MSDISILYEDEFLIALNKRCGDLVQPDRSGPWALNRAVADYLIARGVKEPFVGVVHRLDRPVSGVVLFAKTQAVTASLSSLFCEGGIRKIYWAVTDTFPDIPSGTLIHYIRVDKRTGKSFALDDPVQGAKRAVLDFRLLSHSERYHFLEIVLHTGRQHQIRAQLSRIGCHIKGDVKYGARRTNPSGGIHLHARSLSLPHPVTGEVLCISAPPPHDVLWNSFPQEGK
jgi:23S rRNA pseudouridine1911/1915/1917 synthase